MVIVLSVIAVSLDGGILLTERRRVQGAADAAALAAAADLFKYYASNNGKDTGGTAKQSALTTASADGYSSGEVTVNIPPKAGDHIGVDGYAEVIINHSQSRYFSVIWGSGTITVSGRAVARGIWAVGTATSSNDTFLVTATSGQSGYMNGSTSLDLTRGAIIVNSTGPGVFDTNGGNAEITASAFTFTSSQGNIGSLPNLNGATPQYNQTATADPLSGLSAPSSTGLPSQSYTGQATLNPGIYNGGISVGNNASVTLNPGIYYLQNGGLSLGAGATVDGTSGVLIYASPGAGNVAVSTGGNSTLTLNPINAGTYKGISIFVDRSSTGATVELGGTSAGLVYGTVYAPNANLTMHGTPNLGSQVIVSTFQVKGNVTIDAGSGPRAGQTTGIQLVE
jgi:hypothetical protein